MVACGAALAMLSGCGPSYSPDTYASNAVQQANKVEQGVIVGVRDVGVSAAGTVGTVAGAAAGGIAGSQVADGPITAITALGGSLVGGIAGSAVEHVTADTKAYEYIVRKPNGDLVSVTQKDKVPLVLGMKVLVIAGNQARVVADYTVPPEVKGDKMAGAAKAAVPAAGPAADATAGGGPTAEVSAASGVVLAASPATAPASPQAGAGVAAPPTPAVASVSSPRTSSITPATPEAKPNDKSPP
jgi:outer membrane lipoprotein SlyB